MILNDILKFGGYPSLRPGCAFQVSYWHVPGGTNYDRAVVRLAFFDERTGAEAFAAKYTNPPEMAFVETIPCSPSC